MRRTDISRVVRLGSHPLLLVTFTTTDMRDLVARRWYNILHNDANKFGVREDLTKGQLNQMAYMKPLYKHLCTPGKGKVEGARLPFWRQGYLYYHPSARHNEPRLHPANGDPLQVPAPLKEEMQALSAQLWPGCSLRGTPAAAAQQAQQQRQP
jgi:hypothetical protein